MAEAPPSNPGKFGCAAAGGLAVGLVGGLVGALALVLPIGPREILCPVSGVAVFFGLQVLFVRALRMPVKGPSEPMGAPPEDPEPG